MSELRKDPVVGRWVIIATERGKRPSDFKSFPVPEESGPCPFCEGNESKTPPEIFAFRKPHSHPNGPGWDIRVVPNKFPALRVEGEMEKMGVGMYDKMNGIGAHEVIIETTDHKKRFEDLPAETICRVLETYKMRLEDLMKDSRFRYILIFKNVGPAAGATLEHSHSQLIATPITPKRVKEELVGAQEYHQYKDRCVFCDIIREETAARARMIYENDDFISFCPFAARFPFEIWVLPKKHSADYHLTPPQELARLADCLKVTLSKLAKALNHPQYNYVLHTGPVRWARRGYWATLDYDYHWHIEIIPRITRIAGFEWGSGFYINPTLPEEAAKYMREI